MSTPRPYWMTLPAEPRKLTVNDLERKGACFSQVGIFIHCFDKWILVTPVIDIRVAERFDWWWARNNLLSTTLEKEVWPLFLARRQSFADDCNRIVAKPSSISKDTQKALDYIEYSYDVDLACLFAQAYNADTWQNRLRIRFHNFYHRR